jgi:AcrR family transcriptional regulator
MEKPSKREAGKMRKKELFISSAERLFIQNGFEQTSVDEVAKASGMTKKTLYEYFVSKEDLFYAVILHGVRDLTSAYEAAFEKGDTVREKIRQANMAFLQFYIDNPDMFRLINYQPANKLNCESSPYCHEVNIYDAIRMKHLAELIESGKTDGSIRPGLDIKKAVFFSFFSSFALLDAASGSDPHIWQLLDLNKTDFIRFSFELLSDALK